MPGMSALRSRSASWWSPGPIYRTISACRRCSRQSYIVLHNTTRRLHAAPSRRACHGPARLMTPYSNISLLNHTDLLSYACYLCFPDQCHMNCPIKNYRMLFNLRKFYGVDVKFRFLFRFVKYFSFFFFFKEHSYCCELRAPQKLSTSSEITKIRRNLASCGVTKPRTRFKLVTLLPWSSRRR